MVSLSFLGQVQLVEISSYQTNHTFYSMPSSPLANLPKQEPFVSIFTVDLDAVDTTQLVQALAQHARPQLLVDCEDLRCQQTLGISHVVSQLLLLRQSGASIWLRNVNPVLRRCLHLLRLDSFFLIS
jgi:anti-anti-sigma regulatory factor